MRKWVILILLMICAPLSRVQAQTMTHTVRAGETLTSIAAEYGVSVDALVAANKLTDQNAVYVGERLIIPVQSVQASSSGSVIAAPPSQPGTYTVQAGDTLYGIASKLGTSPTP